MTELKRQEIICVRRTSNTYAISHVLDTAKQVHQLQGATVDFKSVNDVYYEHYFLPVVRVQLGILNIICW